MAQKKITELQLRSEVTAGLNFPSDDGIQSYRVTAAQIKSFVLENDSIATAMILDGAVTRAKLDGLKSVGSMSSAGTSNIAHDLTLLTASGDYTVTLPSGVTNRCLKFVKTDSNNNRITIGSTILISQNDSVEFCYDGSNWLPINLKISDRSLVRYLGSNITTTTAGIASLAFSNLIIGRRYVAFLSCSMSTNASTVTGALTAIHNSITVARNQIQNGAGTIVSHNSTRGVEFVAAATTMSCDYIVSGSGGILFGNGNASATNVTLIELNNSQAGNF